MENNLESETYKNIIEKEKTFVQEKDILTKKNKLFKKNIYDTKLKKDILTYFDNI